MCVCVEFYVKLCWLILRRSLSVYIHVELFLVLCAPCFNCIDMSVPFLASIFAGFILYQVMTQPAPNDFLLAQVRAQIIQNRKYILLISVDG